MRRGWSPESATIVVVVVIAIVVVLFPMAAPPNLFELTAALLRLLAAFAVFADGLVQVLFRFADVIAALVVAVGVGGHGRSSQ